MKACFIGLGYIGLPTAIIAAGKGVDVFGVDINPDVIKATSSGKIGFVEPGIDELLTLAVDSGKLRVGIQPEAADAYIIVVPTPFREGHKPDISFVEAATRSVIPFLKPGNLFIIESTSPVGTTEAMAEIIFHERPELKDRVYVAYCPERVLPGNIIHELVNNDRVIGGINEASARKAAEFYKIFVDAQLHITDARTAEMCKLTENSSRDVQIAFANELSLICDKAGIDVWELISLANRHPRVNILKPGCGVGGHCIAVDPYFLTYAFPKESKLIATAREVNNLKPEWCIEKIRNSILRFFIENGRYPKVALLGLAFKPDIDDLRESPAVRIAKALIEDSDGATILVSEPNIVRYPNIELSNYRSAYSEADIVVFLTAHTVFKALSPDQKKIELDFCGVRKS